MTGPEKTRWKNWADGLRQEMMGGLTAHVTKTVDVVISETASTTAVSTLRSERFWRAVQIGDSPNEVLAKAGFDLEFEQDDDRKVSEVTFRLNRTWLNILDRVLERQNA